MPGSILLNEGRRSVSPDRRVRFGNIERYDILTSNEIQSNMNQKRTKTDIVKTSNGNYPMTRLDNRIRKSIMLGFTYMIGRLRDVFYILLFHNRFIICLDFFKDL